MCAGARLLAMFPPAKCSFGNLPQPIKAAFTKPAVCDAFFRRIVRLWRRSQAQSASQQQFRQGGR
jgi:hypothetical protein